MKPTLGRIVLYKSKIDNGEGNDVTAPALVIRTRETTVPAVINRWGIASSPRHTPDGDVHWTSPRPAAVVAELPDDDTVDLLVHGLGADYREFTVSHGTERGQWEWPPRVPVYDAHTPPPPV